MEPTLSVHGVLGLLLLTGLFFGLIASRLGLPRVAAYVLAGMLFSPSLFGGLIGIRVATWSEPLTTMALGIIAYLIGGSITVAQLRRTGKVILGTAIGETVGAVLAVFAAVWLLLPEGIAGVPSVDIALAFAAIAAPTAPAATVAVLHQYRASGPLSSTLLGVVALDDALGMILFGLVTVITTTVSVVLGLGSAVIEVLGSLAIGVGLGWLLSRFTRRLHQGSLRLPMVAAVILLTLGIADALNLSPLLAAMSLGFASRLFFGAAGDRLFLPLEYFEELVFLLFFTVAGASFEAPVLVAHIELVMVYFVARILGKITGAAVGGRISGAPPPVSRWLGVALIPQAGVAVGLALTLGQHPAFAPVSDVVINVILGSTLLYELAGPLAVRVALGQAGELGEIRRRKTRQ